MNNLVLSSEGKVIFIIPFVGIQIIPDPKFDYYFSYVPTGNVVVRSRFLLYWYEKYRIKFVSNDVWLNIVEDMFSKAKIKLLFQLFI